MVATNTFDSSFPAHYNAAPLCSFCTALTTSIPTAQPLQRFWQTHASFFHPTSVHKWNSLKCHNWGSQTYFYPGTTPDQHMCMPCLERWLRYIVTRLVAQKERVGPSAFVSGPYLVMAPKLQLMIEINSDVVQNNRTRWVIQPVVSLTKDSPEAFLLYSMYHSLGAARARELALSITMEGLEAWHYNITACYNFSLHFHYSLGTIWNKGSY